MRAHRLAFVRFAFVLMAGWVLVEVPASVMNDDDPAIQKGIRVKTFDSRENCDNFRTNAMAEDAEMGMDDGLDQDRQMRCVPEEKLAPKAPAAASDKAN